VTDRRISRAAARRFLARRHLLAPPRSLPPGTDSVMQVFERLGSIQFDPIEVAGRNHDLVLLSRVAGYRREMTDTLLYEERRLFEAYNKGLSLLPTHELPWYRLTWQRARQKYRPTTFIEHAFRVDEIMRRIRAEGPMSSIDFQPRGPIDWHWRPTEQMRALPEALAESGVLAFSRRRGNRRYYDLPERLFPQDVLAQQQHPYEQRLHRLLSRYRGHGMLGRMGSSELWNGAAPMQQTSWYEGPLRGELLATLLERGELVPVAVEGVRDERYVLAEELPLLAAAEAEVAESGDDPLLPPDAGVAFLAALDPLVWDRAFLRSLYDFDYIWEVYVPQRKRQWGYYVLPILWGDRLVGRIEPRIERTSDALQIVDVWWEADFDPTDEAFVAAFADALEAHRTFAGVGRVLLARSPAADLIRGPLGERRPSVGRRARRTASDAPTRPRARSAAPVGR
jgi:uncharacterized protein YcaQ